jgi:hypothetical protein
MPFYKRGDRFLFFLPTFWSTICKHKHLPFAYSVAFEIFMALSEGDLFVCLFVYSHTSNFSAIWWLSPLPVTGLQI